MGDREIEAKFHVKDLKRIEGRLLELEAKLVRPRVHETNLRFDTAHGDLRSKGSVLRLRQDDQVRLTYKGPGDKTDGVLDRKEIEFIVEDFERAKKFIEALGFEIIFYYEKFRSTYELNDTNIMLDELPFGDFVEIEGENSSAIHDLANKLGLKWNAAIPTGYHAIFEHVAKARGLNPNQLTFAVFEGEKPNARELSIVPAD
jgi:adenylate cyclase class 2